MKQNISITTDAKKHNKQTNPEIITINLTLFAFTQLQYSIVIS